MPMRAAGACNDPISLHPFERWSVRAVYSVAAIGHAELLAAHRALHTISQRPLRAPWEIVTRL